MASQKLACVAGVRRGGRGGKTCQHVGTSVRRASFARVSVPSPSPSDACHAGYLKTQLHDSLLCGQY